MVVKRKTTYQETLFIYIDRMSTIVDMGYFKFKDTPCQKKLTYGHGRAIDVFKYLQTRLY